MKSILLRIKNRFLEDAPPGNVLPQLETSWDIRQSIRGLKTRKWTIWDVQYALIVPILLFCLIISDEPSTFIRLSVATVLLLACTMPITSQFWLPALPIITWLILWSSCKFISPEYRPSIFVRVLPALETILFGGNLSEVLASANNAVLDLLAWIPYGLVHFGAPFVVAAILFVFAPPKTLPVFGFAFGWMNLTGVIIQLSFPTAPPWYQIDHGLDPANYSMPGSAGGLARVDKLLGLNLYTGSFGASPLVFGAFPSLHSGSAVMEALFMSYLCPRFMPAFFAYVLWIWWSTMYLTHHYFIDLIGGAALSFCVFYACKMTILPRIQRDRFSRWSYDYIEVGLARSRALKMRKSMDDEEYIELPPIDTGVAEYSFGSISGPHPVPGEVNGNTSITSSNCSTVVSGSSPSSPPTSTSPESKKPLAKIQKEYYHNHHKTSSFHLYEGDLRATSASSPVMTIREEYPLHHNHNHHAHHYHHASVSGISPTNSISGSTLVSQLRSATPSPKNEDSLFTYFRSSSPHQD